MSIDNDVNLCGNATRDPELRFTPGGQAVVSFGLAINERRLNKSTNEWEDTEPTFVDVTAWAQLGENVSESVSRGTRVMVKGRLKLDKWEDKETGAPQSKLVVVAEAVGVDLKWATAEPVRNERAATGPPQQQERAPAAAPGRRGGGTATATRARPATARQAAPVYEDDEEPF